MLNCYHLPPQVCVRSARGVLTCSCHLPARLESLLSRRLRTAAPLSDLAWADADGWYQSSLFISISKPTQLTTGIPKLTLRPPLPSAGASNKNPFVAFFIIGPISLQSIYNLFCFCKTGKLDGTDVNKNKVWICLTLA